MAEQSWQTGPEPVIDIECEALTVIGDSSDQVRAEGEVTLQGVAAADQITLRGRGLVTLHVPAAARLKISARQNTTLTNVLGQTIVRRAHGDLALNGMGPVTIDKVNGDLRSQQQHGPLDWREVHGDVTLSAVSGNVKGNGLGGDLRADDLRGSLVLDGVGGDAHIQQSQGSVQIKAVGGDCVLEAIGGAIKINAVGGDCTARAVSSCLVDHVGGDLVLEGQTGDFHVRNIGGDLRAGGARVAQPMSFNVGGDAEITLAPSGPGSYAIHAGGDIRCNLDAQASATISVHDCEGRQTFHVGAGEAAVSLQAGGDIRLLGADSVQVKRETRDRERGFKMGAFPIRLPPIPPMPPVPKFSFNWSGFSRGGRHAAPPPGGAPPQDIELAIRNVVSNSVSSAVSNAVSAVSAVARPAPARAARPEPDVPVIQVTDQERMLILKMLSEKKITVEQADQLLAALDG